MTFDAFGLTLNVVTIGIISLWIAMVFLSSVGLFCLNYFNAFSAVNRSRLLWVSVVLPWVTAVASVLLLLAPELFELQIGSLSSLIHWHHAYVFHIFSWHGALLLVFSAIFFVVSITKLSRAIRNSLQLSQLDYFSVSEELEDGTLLVGSDTPQAFTAGLLSPRSYITQGLRNSLTVESLAVIQRHELAHKLRKDPLRKFLFSLFASFFPKASGTRLNDAFSLALEQIADQSTISSVHDRTIVSKTILQVARLNNKDQNNTNIPLANCGFTSNALQSRVRYLLDDEPVKPFPITILMVSALTMISLCTLSVDFIHHSVETLFSH
jgi:beta-lactamase regulating signal transducer with metallopeptidase domain